MTTLAPNMLQWVHRRRHQVIESRAFNKLKVIARLLNKRTQPVGWFFLFGFDELSAPPDEPDQIMCTKKQSLKL